MFRKTAFWLTIAIFLLSPFHAFLVTWFRSFGISPQVDFFISAWREILILVLALLLVIHFIRERKWPFLNRSEIQFYLPLFGFFLLAGIFLFVQKENFLQWLWGARFDLLPFFFYFVLFLFRWDESSAKRAQWFIIYGSIPILLFGLIHTTLLPQNFLHDNFGYSINRDIWNIEEPISSCQYLEHTQQFCRATSTFGGPTRFGAYLLFLLPLLFIGLKESKKTPGKFLFVFLIGITMINIFLTFSRSIWIGLVVMMICSYYFLGGDKKIKQFFLRGPEKGGPDKEWAALWLSEFRTGIVFAFIFFSLSFISFLFYPDYEIFIRQSSTSEHFMALKNGIDAFLQHPFGIGLGTVGPASLRFEKFVTENWYLQIGIEMGVIGLALFLWMMGNFLKFLLRKSSAFGRALGLSLIGLLVAALFTHAFEETTTSLLLFGFIGMYQHASTKN